MLKHDEIPSFLHPYSLLRVMGGVILEHIKRLQKPFSILIDTFQELEKDTIDHMSQLCPQVRINSIGPLFMMGKFINSDIKGDIFEPASDCIEWLDTREPSSVVYISFGTVVHLKQEQIEEIAHGLLNSDLSYLWVKRPPTEGLFLEPHVLPRELKEKGKIVEWCPQEKVLAHPSVACFLSHCRWNSTMEALTSGVPMVCFPQWGDQVTNAVYIIDVFKTGVRLSHGETEDRIVPRKEVAERLLEASVGEKAVGLRENAQRWKEEAEAAVTSDGSSDRNFQEFVDKLVAVKATPKIIIGLLNHVFG
ncbi:UDP-glycosyltransferase 84A4 [Cardamine amara subsp. amara]|uniref:UDP-glycosyltransferase 84A4 n=1 Tax=Cardamine amara subsp. amara TaxID=228776 RepID=A0ABD1BTS6_CARAN